MKAADWLGKALDRFLGVRLGAMSCWEMAMYGFPLGAGVAKLASITTALINSFMWRVGCFQSASEKQVGTSLEILKKKKSRQTD